MSASLSTSVYDYEFVYENKDSKMNLDFVHVLHLCYVDIVTCKH